MGKPFLQEIDQLHNTCQWAFEQNVKELERLLKRWTEGPLIVVGSGGSYSAAFAWAAFHRVSLGQPCFASTPLNLKHFLTSLTQCRVLLLSAEGRNNDIIHAAKLAKSFDAPCAALTLTPDNPLTKFSKTERSLYSFPYSMDWGKDGYLATNTLLAMVLLAARTYFATPKSAFAENFTLNSIEHERKILSQYAQISNIRASGALVLHGPNSALFAVDLESKIAEASLAKCEIADFRQFAHGRHLQLAQSEDRIPVVILAYTPDEEVMVHGIIAIFPSTIKHVKIPINGLTSPEQSISALLKAILITEAIGNSSNIDPGQPSVPEFGRNLYAQDPANFLEPITTPSLLEVSVRRKIGKANATTQDEAIVATSAKAYLKKIEDAHFRALICDFDGTLCNAHERFSGINCEIADHLKHLLGQGLQFGIATGRGNSVVNTIKDNFSKKFWSQIWMGLYNGSVVSKLDNLTTIPATNLDLQHALDWLKNTGLRRYAIENENNCKVGQLTIRVEDHLVASRVASAFSLWIKDRNLIGWRVYSSGHSVDLLDASTSKLNVVARMASDLKIDSRTEILRIGDAGHAGGNDFELLRDAYSLSAEKTSDSLTCCWNLAPSGLKQAEATMFYLRSMSIENEYVRVRLFDQIKSPAMMEPRL